MRTTPATGNSDPDHWDRVEQLFEQALALPPADRAAFLEAVAGADAALRDELASLLSHASDALHYFDRLTDLAAEVARTMAGTGDPMAVPGDGSIAARTTGERDRFRIEGELGHGGMGVVYRAFDELLQRTVALKFLPPELSAAPGAAARLVAEARAAAALEHPNVCTIHEVGITTDGRVFLAMPCYDGETLKRRLEGGPLPVDRAMDCAAQIAAGLAAAHAAGLVHGDVKPGNVMVTSGGVVKLLDFGVARRGGQPVARPLPGTLAYMAAEQIAGGAVDARTDLWALGVVLYEMLAGVRPVTADDTGATLDGVLQAAIAPVQQRRRDVPDDVAAIVTRLLERDPARRFASAGAVISAIERCRAKRRNRLVRFAAGSALTAALVAGLALHGASSGGESLRTIAVLPLANAGGDPDHSQLTGALHQLLIAELGRIEMLIVIGPEPVASYDAAAHSMRGKAAELGADALVHGSVLVRGDSVRLALRLTDAASERALWAGAFDTELGDVLSLHGQAAREVARVLSRRLGERPPGPLRVGDIDPRAQQAFLGGLYHMQENMQTLRPGGDPDSVLHLAIADFEEAIRIEPAWADAHAHLASVYHMYASMPGQQRAAEYEKSKSAALRALALDPGNAQAHGALGFVRFSHERDFAGAERALLRAIELDANSPYAWSHAMLLQLTGRHDEAIAAFHRAEARNPTAERLKLQIANAYTCADRHDEAIAQMEEVIRRVGERADAVQRGAWRAFIARRHSSMGRHDRALAEIGRAVELAGDPGPILGSLAFVHARAGRTADARDYLNRIEARGPGAARAVPEVYAALGDTETAVANVLSTMALQPRFADRFPCTEGYRMLRDDPRIRELVPTAWRG